MLPIAEYYTQDEDRDLMGAPGHYSKYLKWAEWRLSIVEGKVGDKIRGYNPPTPYDENYLAVVCDMNFSPIKYVHVKLLKDKYRIAAIYNATDVKENKLKDDEEFYEGVIYAGVKGKKLY